MGSYDKKCVMLFIFHRPLLENFISKVDKNKNRDPLSPIFLINRQNTFQLTREVNSNDSDEWVCESFDWQKRVDKLDITKLQRLTKRLLAKHLRQEGLDINLKSNSGEKIAQCYHVCGDPDVRADVRLSKCFD